MAGTEISKPQNDPLAVFENRRAVLDAEASMTDTSTADWIKGKVGAILEATDFAAINALMDDAGLTPAKSLVGRTLTILDLAVRESAPQYRDNAESFSALQKFCIVKAADHETGEEFIIDGGGDQFVAGLVSMRDLYGFPFTGTLLGKTTGSGNTLQYWRFHDPKRKPGFER